MTPANQEHENWTLLGEILYKWTANPTFHAGHSLFKVLLNDIEKRFDEQLKLDPSTNKIYMTRQEFYKAVRIQLSMEIKERSKHDMYVLFLYNEAEDEITHVVFENYRTFKHLVLNADELDGVVADMDTKELTFDELFDYVVNGHLGGESGTRCAMLAYDGNDRCAIGKAIGFIVASAAKLGVKIEPKTFNEHIAIKQKVRDKSSALFNNSDIKLPRYAITGDGSFGAFVELRLAMTCRLLEQKLKTDDLIEMSVSEQQ